MEMEDFSAHLLDDEQMAIAEAEAEAAEGNQCCPACGTLSTSPHPWKQGRCVKFVRANKDEFCHCVHLLLYGEQTWAASWQPRGKQERGPIFGSESRLSLSLSHFQDHNQPH